MTDLMQQYNGTHGFGKAFFQENITCPFYTLVGPFLLFKRALLDYEAEVLCKSSRISGFISAVS